MKKLARRILLCKAALLSIGSCFDRGDRWLGQSGGNTPICLVGDQRCFAGRVQRCESHGKERRWQDLANCAAKQQVCDLASPSCKTCHPGKLSCEGQEIASCSPNGDKKALTGKRCDETTGQACRDGTCVDLCGEARELRSNVGCEYWAADLDNANVGVGLNAAAQQFAVVVSNPHRNVSVDVSVEQDNTQPGTKGLPVQVATLTVPPRGLRVINLGPREVDGSPPGEFDTGSHTALTRAAYRLRSTFPVVAYQFNPLENVGVFSNDASLLKPVEALNRPGSLQLAYVAIGWPQTIAITEDPKTNFNPNNPTNLRAFLTVVATRPKTKLVVKTTTPVVAGDTIPAANAGDTLEFDLDAFDVVNLETGDFGSDFSGSEVFANQPVVVFSGSEASDAPLFSDLAQRQCCADHLEEQLDPLRSAGKRFIASVSANRTDALIAAGAKLGPIKQPEYFRVISVAESGARINTTLAGTFASFELNTRGAYADIQAETDFALVSDKPVILASISASQEAAGIAANLPGGDPSFIIIPPIEQYRDSYVLLTPDKYAFDFLRILAPRSAHVLLDGTLTRDLDSCHITPVEVPELGGYSVIRCQLSFPEADKTSASFTLLPGLQDDGVHRIEADARVGVLVDGFDAYVSYGYAGGTDLKEIVPK